jgi:hypothetical protein
MRSYEPACRETGSRTAASRDVGGNKNNNLVFYEILQRPYFNYYAFNIF